MCAFQLGDAMTFQSGPLVYDGTLFVTTDLATVALDAATCKPGGGTSGSRARRRCGRAIAASRSRTAGSCAARPTAT